MFTVKHQTADSPANDVSGRWGYSSTLDVLKMSAVALAFAREVNQKLNVPVGIISSCWGGTPVEAWTSREALDRDDRLQPLVTKYLNDLQQYPIRKAAYDEAVQQWTHGKAGGENQGFINGWALPQFNDADWKTVQGGLDVNTTEGREVDGAFWYRATVNFPDEWYGKPLKLSLGALAEYDTTYVNDVRVGYTDQKTRDASSLLRVYPVAPGIVRRGANNIAVRVFSPQGVAGMVGPAEEMRIGPADGSASIPLSGDWKFKIEQELDPNTPRPALPIGPGNPRSPTELFSGMIAPLIRYGIKGAIWYQGEQNVGGADTYGELFPDMIHDWRTRWGEGTFPFYFVQLPNFHDPVTNPGDSDWARLREAQTLALALPSTGMAVTIDLGEAKTIHPTHKREVGRRLALWALGKTYHQPVYYGSPIYHSMTISGSAVSVSFTNGSLTTTDGSPPTGFELAGEDHKFYWATAKLDGSTVTLSTPQVAKPVAVRYAWADNPPTNLTNHEGLPAAPFRTDTWTKNQ
jgi:sialate O-acetylesterase